MPGLTLAHGAAPATDHYWSAVVAVLLGATLAAWYGRGVQELWTRRGAGAVVAPVRVAAFGTGLVVLVVAQIPAAQEAAERSFAGHMTQHMVLLVVVAPLLAAGAAGLPLTLAAPHPARRWLARVRTSALVRWTRRSALLVVVAGGFHTVVLWGWHLPGPYLAAVENPVVHALEHASLFAAAWWLWSAVLGAHPVNPPTGFLLLFAAGMPAAALGAVLTFAPQPLYPAGVLAVAGGSPLADQQLAGLVMWIPMDVVVFSVAIAIFLAWLLRLDRDLHPDDQQVMASEEART